MMTGLVRQKTRLIEAVQRLINVLIPESATGYVGDVSRGMTDVSHNVLTICQWQRPSD